MNQKTAKLIHRLVYATAHGETPTQTRARYQGVKQAFLDLPRPERAAYLARIGLAAKAHADKMAEASTDSA